MKRTIRKTRQILIALTIALIVSGFSVLQENQNITTPVYADTKVSKISVGDNGDKNPETTGDNSIDDKKTDQIVTRTEDNETMTDLDNETEEGNESLFFDMSDIEYNKDIVTPHESQIHSSEVNPQSRAALPSYAMVVTSFGQLRDAIQASGMVNGQQKTIYYLGSDIIGERNGIVIPSGYTFVLDGKDPNTQAIHTYYEYGGSTDSDTIRYSASTKQGTNNIRNIRFIGQNKSGFFSSRYADATFDFTNIDYKGPKIATIPNGVAVFRNSNINITTVGSVSSEQVASAREIYLTDTNNITTSVDLRQPVFTATEQFVVAGDTQNINTASQILNSTKASIIIIEGTQLNIIGQSVGSETLTGGFTSNSFDNAGKIVFNSNKLQGNVVSATSFNNRGEIRAEVGTISTTAINTTTFDNTGTISIKSNQVNGDGINSKTLENKGTLKLDVASISGIGVNSTSITNAGLLEINSDSFKKHVISVTDFTNDGTILIDVIDVIGTTSDVINSKNLTNNKNINLKTTVTGNSFINNSNTIINKGNIKIDGQRVGRDLIYSLHYFYNFGDVDLSADTVGSYGIRVEINNKDSFINNGGNIKIRANKISNFILYSYYFINRNDANVDINVLEGGSTVFGIVIYRDNIFENSTAKFVIGNPNQESKPRTNMFYTDAYGKFEFNDSRVTIDATNSGYTNIFNTSSVKFLSTGTVPAFLNILNYSGATNFGSYGTKFDINTQQINTWTSKPVFPNFPDSTLGNASRFVMNDYRNFGISGSISSKGDPTFDKTSTPSTDTTSINDNLTFKNQEVISMGNMMLDVPKNTESLKQLKLTTNPESWVQLASKPIFETYADAQGNVDVTLPQGVHNDNYQVNSFGNYLYRNSNVQYHVDGDLSILEIPTQISFPEIELKPGPNYYDRDSQMKIIIEDNRLNKTGWKLSVRMVKPLQISGRPESRLDKALQVNKNAIGEELVTVYETTGLDYSSNTEVI
ncbi:MAG: hypothetical protein RR422_06980, partial [Erysipelothrix sp.]